MIFFTGDRASDLGRLLANQVFRLKDRKGFLLQLTLTKTTWGSVTSLFILEPFEDAGSALLLRLSIICLFVICYISCWMDVISLGLLTAGGPLAKSLSWVLQLIIVYISISQGRG